MISSIDEFIIWRMKRGRYDMSILAMCVYHIHIDTMYAYLSNHIAYCREAASDKGEGTADDREGTADDREEAVDGREGTA